MAVAACAAGALPYEGLLEQEIGPLAPPGLGGSGDGVSEPGSVVVGPGATFTTIAVLPVDAFPIVQLALTGPAGLTFASVSDGGAPDGGFGGDAPLTGNLKIGLFGPPPFDFLTVPLSPIGAEGATAMVSSALGVSVTVFGSGWTTGTVQVIGTTGAFDGAVLARATGGDARTPGGLGTIVLVTPTLTRTNVAGSENLPIISTLSLTFVPEPGTLALLGTGVAALAAFERRRRIEA